MDSRLAIDVDALNKTFRSGFIRRKRFQALSDVSFQVPQGQIFGLLGPNGAGKTTFIKVLLGIVRKSSGSAKLLGRSAGDRTSRHNVGYLPENFRVAGHHTARSSLRYFGGLSGLSPQEADRRGDALLDKLALGDWKRVSVRKFSKGMLQRLGLAQALLHDPQLLVLDEPTDGLDPVGRSQVRELLLELKSQGKTIFLNSHLLQEVERVCDQVAILHNGSLRFVGRIDEVTRRLETDEIELELAAPESEVRAALDSYPSREWDQWDDHQFRVVLQLQDQQQIDDCIDNLRQHGVSVVSLVRRRGTLEEAFMQIIDQKEDRGDT